MSISSIYIIEELKNVIKVYEVTIKVDTNVRLTPGTTLLIGSWNERGCSTCETKRSEIGSVMLERKLEVLALSETKVKGKGERIFGSVVGRESGVVNGHAREGVALLLSKRVLEGAIEYSRMC